MTLSTRMHYILAGVFSSDFFGKYKSNTAKSSFVGFVCKGLAAHFKNKDDIMLPFSKLPPGCAFQFREAGSKNEMSCDVSAEIKAEMHICTLLYK